MHVPLEHRPEEIDIARLRHIQPRHYGRMIAIALIIAFAAFIATSFANSKIDWHTAGAYLFWPSVLAGLINTVWLSVASMTIGIMLGVLCAIARASPNPILNRTGGKRSVGKVPSDH